MSSENELLQTQLTEAKEALKAANVAKAELEKKVTEAGIAQYESKIVALEADVKSLNDKIQGSEAEVKTAKEEVNTLTTKANELAKVNQELSDKLAKVEAEKIVASRISMLVEGGIARDVAEKKVQTFSNLNDEQFTDLSQELIQAAKKMTDEEKKKAAEDEKKKQDKEKAKSVDEAALENAEAEKEIVGSPAPESVQEELTEVRKSLASFVRSRVGKPLEEDEEEGE